MLKLDIDRRPKIRRLEITTKNMVSTNFMGDYPSVFKGRGIIFESFREYTSGDDASMIDWTASMRAGKTLVREFVEERNLDVFFLVDASASMVFGSRKKLKHEFAADIVASMTYAILDKGDSVGLGLFSDDVRGMLIPEHGIRQYRRVIAQLSNPEYYDGPCDFARAIEVCFHRLRPRTILIIITDMINVGEGWENALRTASTKFDVIPIILRDPRDDEMPKECGQVIVEEPLGGEQVLIDTNTISHKFSQESRHILDSRIEAIKQCRVADVGMVNTSRDFAKDIVKFFERRKRRWR